MIEKVQKYIRDQRLITAGDRIAVAVSGGADSVALLRLLLELRQELGIVLAVAHFNHQIRGADADEDEQFVRSLAQQFDLEFQLGFADVPAHAQEKKLSLETAARELRHAWFATLLREGHADKIATAHTEDDQAETVLMRMIRGAGTRGLAGIAPWQKEKRLIRPLLCVTRGEIEDYLKRLGQPWREDQSNQDVRHARNRIRHELLPVLQRDYNPSIRRTLADFAEVARAEEEYWEKELAPLVTRLVRSGKPSRSGRTNRKDIPPTLALDLSGFQALPLAIQRRILRFMGEQFGVTLEFKHIQELLLFTRQKKPGRGLSLPGGLVASSSYRELYFGRQPENEAELTYQYALPIPGEIMVPELGSMFRANLVSAASPVSGYNAALLDPALLASELTVRNWHAGDRFFPAHTRSPRKVKELLQPGRLGQELSLIQRKIWPVVESGGEIVWVRGFPVPQAYAAKSGQAILIEEITMGSGA